MDNRTRKPLLRFYGTDCNDWCEVLSEVTIMEDGTYSIVTVLVEKLSEPPVDN